MKKIKIDQDLDQMIESGAQACIGCQACMRGCPMLDAFTDQPKALLEDLDQEGYFTPDLPYSCMLCGYCEEICPVDISFKDIFFKMRRLYVEANDGNIGKEVKASSTNFHQTFAFSKIFTDPIAHQDSDICYFPGCALIANNPDLVEDSYAYLQEIYPGIGYWNICCGKPTNFLGREELFRERIGGLQEEYRAKGLKRIVTACQNCTITLEEYCPDLEVIPIYKILADHFPEEQRGKFKDTKVNIHDPCPSRQDKDLQDSARQIAQDLGFEIEELRYSKKRTICCSSGGMVPQTAPAIAETHAARRAGEGDCPMVTYCKECENRLHSQRTIDHLLDLVFLDEDQAFTNRAPSTLGDWANKFKARRIAR